MHSALYKTLIIWVLFWYACAGTVIYILAPAGVDQMSNFIITSSCFLFFAVFGGFYYKIHERFPHHASFSVQIPLFMTVIIVYFVVGYFVPGMFPITDAERIHIVSSKFYFPLFTAGTLITKLCDVIFQQVFIYGILKTLKKNHSDIAALKIFSIVFFSIHLPLLFSMKWYGFYFIIPSLFAGTLFSYFIIFQRFGLTQSLSLHLIFYLLIGIGLRL